MKLVRKVRRDAGFTLIELMIGAVLTGIVLGSVILATKQSTAAFRRNAANSALDANVARALNKIERELAASSAADFAALTGPGVWQDAAEVQVALDYVAGAVVWGPTVRLALEYAPGELDNGVDDNSDGLIDEGVIVRIENPGAGNEQRVVIAKGISEFLEGELDNAADDNGNGLADERGLSFELVDGALNVRISMERIGPDERLMVRTLETSLAIRN